MKTSILLTAVLVFLVPAVVGVAGKPNIIYYMADDIGEDQNLIDSTPGIARQLSGTLDAWLKQRHPTWQPKYPVDKKTGRPAGPPPALQ